jgi:hypothetical protein
MSKNVRDRGIFDNTNLETCLSQAETSTGYANIAFLCCGLESWFRQFVDGEKFRDLQVPHRDIATTEKQFAGHEELAAGD